MTLSRAIRRLMLAVSLLIATQAPAASPPPPLQPITLFREGEGACNNYRIPSLIVTPKKTVLAFCEGRQTPYGRHNDTGEINVTLRRSTDGGLTFSPPQVVWADGKNTCGNPCPVVDESTGTIWLLLTRNLGVDVERDINAGTAKGTRTVWVTSSTDDGVTWAEPREITADVKKPEWRWYATGPGVGIQIKHGPHAGRLVVPCDYTYKTADKSAGNSHVIYSDDQGLTWKLGGEPPGQRGNESQVVELSDGRLMLNMRNFTASGQPKFRARGVAVSDDGGATFGKADYDPALVEPICQASILRYAWPEDGRGVILFSNPAQPRDRVELTVRASFDDGRTWPVSRLIYRSFTGYSCLARLPDGSVGLLYEAGDKRRYERIDFVRFPLDSLTATATSAPASRPVQGN